MIKVRKENDEVLYPDEDLVAVTAADLAELKRLALLNPRRRVRLCAHRSPDDRFHEMFIVHARDCYVRPHQHLDKEESITVLEGEADLILFTEDGDPRQVVRMGPPASGKPFFLRVPERTFHMLIIQSDLLVFLEAAPGPFVRGNTVFPEWAPEEGRGSDDFTARIRSFCHA